MKVIVIAEAASQHGGDVGLAKRYIEEARKSGADAVKFQYFNVDDGFFPEDDPRFGQVKVAQLGLGQLAELKEHCERVGIEFLCTPFHSVRRVEELASLGMKRVKIREADSKNEAMIKKALELHGEVYVSTTRIPLDPFLLWNPHIRWLMATPKYPYPIEEVDLGRATAFDGISDHTVGITVPIAACSVAAASGKDLFIVEKHVTLDHSIDNLDREVSIDFSELAELVRHLRTIERVK